MAEVYEIYDFEHDSKAETVYVEAEVEDSVLAFPATLYEPEQWTHGRCSTSIFWDTEEDGPVSEDALSKYFETYTADWILIPFDDSEDLI